MAKPLSRSRFRYNELANRYTNRSGRFVPMSQVRQELDRALLDIGKEAKALAEQLRTRQITAEQWTLDMRHLVKEVHLWSAADAKGGWAQMAQADYGRVGQIIRGEYAFLQRFSAQINLGLALDGQFLQRAQQYTQAGRRTFHAVEIVEKEQRGMTEERSIRHVGDSCVGCIFEAVRGWIPIGTGVPIGMRDCLRKCRCTKLYR